MSDDYVINFDRLLSDLGEFGRFQKILYTCLCIPCIFPAIFTLSSVFTAAKPQVRCQIPICDRQIDPDYSGNKAYLVIKI